MYPKTLFILCAVLGFVHHVKSGKTGVVKIDDSNWAQTLEGEWLIKL